jgi:DNA-binding response OmpR family regulator
MTTRLLIVDDDPEITSAVLRGLAMHGFDGETANRADVALDLLENGNFAAAIVDVMLGADSGLDLVREARRRGVAMPILMLSALAEVEDRAAGLEAGANDYVIKPFSFDELAARLRVQALRIHRDEPVSSVLEIDHRRLRCGTGDIELTEREIGLLAFLARHAGSPVPRGDIFDALWSEGSTSENVVDVYIGYLRKKLAAHETGFRIETMRNKGFVLDGTAPRIEGASDPGVSREEAR